MNYKVLYRKYRPDNFENIIGQDYIIKTLKNSIINKNISHAYIFSGPRGTGKTSTAKVFSKAINCSCNNDGSPCGNCEFCVNFTDNPDIIEIDAASNNGVDEIRTLIDNIKLTPTNGNYKVYIIDEVHMLTTSAFNALLLTLEEPPKHAVFILATTNIENVPITILSRCQRYDFQKIKVEDITNRLQEICKIEEIDIEDEALNEIAYLSEGGLRDALSLLDQLSKSNQKITLDLVEKQIKIVSHKTLSDLLEFIEKNELDNFFNIINDFRIRAVDYKTLIKRLIENASNIAKNIKKTGKYNRLTFIDYKNLILNLTECLSKININIEPYTILEILLLEFFDISGVDNTDNVNEFVFEKIKKIETENVNKFKETEIKNKNSDNIQELIKIRINNCFVNAQKKYLEEMKNDIKKYETSTIISGKIRAILLDSKLVASSDKNIIFACENEHVMDNANKLVGAIEKDLENIIFKKIKVIFITKKDWNIEKQKYINNLKNNIKYEYIEEKSLDEEKNTIVSDVFDLSKVEII